MRKEQIVLGVEYSATAPLAYGVEPHTPARRVRFLSLEPHIIVRKYEVTNPDTGTLAKTVWTKVLPVTQASQYLPVTKAGYNFAKNNAPGTEFYQHEGEKGALLAERWDNQKKEWVAELVRPAEVHRTWEEEAAKQEEARRRRQERQQQAAPRVMRNSAYDLVNAARLVHKDLTRKELHAAVEAIIQEELDRAFQGEEKNDA